ncbi:hypothetical protein RSAG8_03011, partial [Rhizoctonia solani AG-8 WAC10335]
FWYNYTRSTQLQVGRQTPETELYARFRFGIIQIGVTVLRYL